MSKPFYVYISTIFGLGFLTKMPGTLGSFAALIIDMFYRVPLWAIILVTIIGIYTSGLTEDLLKNSEPSKFPDIPERYFKITDPSCAIIDEVAGMWLSTYLLPNGFLIAGFFLFRLVDILKPWPVSLFEKLPRGWGIMFDDIAGGILVNIFLQILNAYLYHNGWIYSLIMKFSGA